MLASSLVARDAGVVDHDVDAAELVLEELGDLLGRLGIGDVGQQHGATDACAPLRWRAVVGGAVEHHHVGAFGGQDLGGGLADAARGAGDQHDLAVERTRVGVAGARPWRSCVTRSG